MDHSRFGKVNGNTINGSLGIRKQEKYIDQYTKNIKDGSFEITLGNMAADDHFEIRYDVKLDYEPADGELLKLILIPK